MCIFQSSYWQYIGEIGTFFTWLITRWLIADSFKLNLTKYFSWNLYLILLFCIHFFGPFLISSVQLQVLIRCIQTLKSLIPFWVFFLFCSLLPNSQWIDFTADIYVFVTCLCFQVCKGFRLCLHFCAQWWHEALTYVNIFLRKKNARGFTPLWLKNGYKDFFDKRTLFLFLKM